MQTQKHILLGVFICAFDFFLFLCDPLLFNTKTEIPVMDGERAFLQANMSLSGCMFTRVCVGESFLCPGLYVRLTFCRRNDYERLDSLNNNASSSNSSQTTTKQSARTFWDWPFWFWLPWFGGKRNWHSWFLCFFSGAFIITNIIWLILWYLFILAFNW